MITHEIKPAVVLGLTVTKYSSARTQSSYLLADNNTLVSLVSKNVKCICSITAQQARQHGDTLKAQMLTVSFWSSHGLTVLILSESGAL